jgi:zinc D-Ala-D-Ala carboxypeptidase
MRRRTFLKYSTFLFTLANAPLSFAQTSTPVQNLILDAYIKDQLQKKRHFNKSYEEDLFIDKKFLPLLDMSVNRLKKVQKIVGYGNFCLLNFDDAIKIGRSYSKVGAFTKQELDFLEMIFYSKVEEYGFMGKKTIKTITEKIIKKDVKKIAYTGNYLYRGKPVAMYGEIKNKLGSDVILTSGIRSIIKQFLLFLNKTRENSGNLSIASRSLAPPGYSFHGIGDFDVGKKGYGVHNFTERFTKTKVYQKLNRLGFIKFRYKQDNNLGVRFEPWHIEVI